ncbi:hypothetical protein [Vibrio hibernica]|uniref:hypothetical protein n=1 Tax=Vibrio hibernica TaxID=2587465 RepID=UPI00188167AF|nr:hypothetical protein [Vibrio hibernica]
MAKLKDTIVKSINEQSSDNTSTLDIVNTGLIRSLEGVNIVLEEANSRMKNIDNALIDYLDKNKDSIERKRKAMDEHKKRFLNR